MNNTRASDPITSVIAGERAALFAGKHNERILAALNGGDQLTAYAIGQRTKLSVEQVCRRMTELQAKGLVRVRHDFSGAAVTDGRYRVWEAV